MAGGCPPFSPAHGRRPHRETCGSPGNAVPVMCFLVLCGVPPFGPYRSGRPPRRATGGRSGLRPPQLYSVYEAAVFCLLSARRSGLQARRMRTELAQHACTVI